MLLHSELELVRALEAGNEPDRPRPDGAPAGREERSSEIDEIVRGLDEA